LPEKKQLKLQFASGSQTSERAAIFVQAELAKIGIELVLESMPLRALFGKMREKSHAPLVLFAWRSSPDWDAYAMLHSTGTQNYSGFKDAELDRLLDRAKYELDPTQWAAALGEVEERYNQLLPTIPLLFRQAVSVRPIALEGWTPTGATTPVTWNAETWRWRR
jgi:peptide/nickel transport system substrate-binding protein